MLPNGTAALEDAGDAEPAHRRRIVDITKRRQALRFIICDASMRVLFAAPKLEALFDEAALLALEPICRKSKLSRETVVVAHDDQTVLRIVPMDGHMFGCVAIFIDSFDHRGPVFEAAKKFGLTRRESEVLQLILCSKSNGEIAAALCVAESTVGDHVKSVMRKTGSTRRGETVGKVFDLDLDLQAPIV